jgi:DNA topoisomerase-3
LARDYVIKKGRAIHASDAAFTLIDAVPATIADPVTTAIWEQALDMIEAGQMTLDVFIDKQSAWITQLVQQYRYTTLSIKQPEGPVCPVCSSPTRQRVGKSGAFWSCGRYPDCKGTVPIAATSNRHTATRRPRRRPSPRTA